MFWRYCEGIRLEKYFFLGFLKYKNERVMNSESKQPPIPKEISQVNYLHLAFE